METKRYEFKKLTKSDFVRLLTEVLGYSKHDLTHYEDGVKAVVRFSKLRGSHAYFYNCALGEFSGHLFCGGFSIIHGGMWSEEQTRTVIDTQTLIRLGFLIEKAA